MNRWFWRAGLGLALMVCAIPDAFPAAAQGATLHRVRVAEVINPVVASFVTGELEKANRQGAEAFLCELDTPGGLDTAMRSIIQEFLRSEVPVIVHVAPPGARAASAGALITLAADFAAMAPGTNIGAAHPVAIGGGPAGEGEQQETMAEKVVNDAAAYARSIAEQRDRNPDWAERMVRESVSLSANRALELGLVDLLAEDQEELLRELDGRGYLRGGKERRLRTAGATLVTAEMNWRQEVLNAISHPNVAYLLMMLGILGIFFEISQPGVILPGAVGAIAILLALFAFQTLPVNYAGVLLILLALVLFILEIWVVSYGMLSIGGIVCLTFGSLMLIESPAPFMQIDPEVIAAAVASCSTFFLLVLFFVARTQGRRFFSGAEGMAGERGEAVTAVEGEGRVFVHGEYWDASSTVPIPAGSEIEVVRIVEGLRLEVRPLPGAQLEKEEER